MLDPLLLHLHAALESSLGVKVESTDPHRLRQKFYALRKAQEPLFDSLSFAIHPSFPSQIWIVKRCEPKKT